MQIEDLVLDDDGHRHFENMSDLDAVIIAWQDDSGMHHGCAVNPNLTPERELGALGWCAQLVTRIEDHGFEQAMQMDAWQHRSDGRWQLWGRLHDLPLLN